MSLTSPVYENITKESSAEMSSAAASEVRVVSEAALAVTETTLAPSVALGIIALTPFIASAVWDRAANPTEGGSYRNTEYTFF
jgi:hypothetical protein